MEYGQALNMAKVLKKRGNEIRAAIQRAQAEGHGVVELRFSQNGTEMELTVADEPFQPDVRVFPG